MGLALVAAPIAARLALLEGRPAWSGVIAAIALLPGMIGLSPLTMKLLDIWLDPLLACIFLVTVTIPRAISPAAWGVHKARVAAY
jgi:hypothetical protein